MILIPSTEVMLSDIVPIRKGKSRGSTKKDSKKTTKLKSFNSVWGDRVTFCVYGNMPIICMHAGGLVPSHLREYKQSIAIYTW